MPITQHPFSLLFHCKVIKIAFINQSSWDFGFLHKGLVFSMRDSGSSFFLTNLNSSPGTLFSVADMWKKVDAWEREGNISHPSSTEKYIACSYLFIFWNPRNKHVWQISNNWRNPEIFQSGSFDVSHTNEHLLIVFSYKALSCSTQFS